LDFLFLRDLRDLCDLPPWVGDKAFCSVDGYNFRNNYSYIVPF